MSTIRRPPGCTCLYEHLMIVKRCDQCEAELTALRDAWLASKKAKKRKRAAA